MDEYNENMNNDDLNVNNNDDVVKEVKENEEEIFFQENVENESTNEKEKIFENKEVENFEDSSEKKESTTESKEDKEEEKEFGNKVEVHKTTKEETTVLNKEEFVSIKRYRITLVLLLIFALVMSTVSSYFAVKVALNSSVKTTVVYETPTVSTETTTSTNDLTSVIENISDTVVEVYTEAVTYSYYYGNYVTEGAGSGVVYSSEGYIITNNHVIDGATSIKVKTTDGTEYEAELIATDEVSDLAVLKINASGLHSVLLGSSSTLKVGSTCIAIGNPLGTLGGTVTTGIISALSREIKVEGQTMTLLQTNASINPGNSGGGLFNESGELIGIVNAKSSGSDIEGIGFAIPVDEVKEVVTQLIENGYVLGRPAIGITCVSIDTIQKAWSYGVNNYGVYVSEVNSDETAAAGLQAGDLITAINGTTVTSFDGLKSVLNNYSAGDTITLSVSRGNTQIEIDVVLQQKTK